VGRVGSGNAWLDDAPNTVAETTAGTRHVAVAWARAPAGSTITLRVRERSDHSSVRTAATSLTGDGTWRELLVTTAPASGGTSLSVEVLVSLPHGGTAHVDDVSLKRL
jgi:hypothetical protein